MVAAVAAAVAVAGSVGLIVGRMSAGPGRGGIGTAAGDPSSAVAAPGAGSAGPHPLLALQAEAESQAVAGRLVEARATYRAFLAAASAKTDDARVRHAVDQAAQDLALVERLLARRESGAVGVAMAPATRMATSAVASGAPVPPATTTAATGSPPPTSPPVPGSSTAPAPAAVGVPPASQPSPEVPAVPPAPPLPAATPVPLVEVPEPPMRAEPRVRLQPATTAVAAADPATLDDRIDAAIRRGSDFLLAQFQVGNPAAARPPAVNRPATRPAVNRMELFKALKTLDGRLYGSYVMAVYALASAGRAVDDPRLSVSGDLLAPMLDKLASLDLQMTYSRGFRAAALAVHARPADRPVLAADAAWLVEMGGADGRYPYGPSAPVYPKPLAVAKGGPGPGTKPAAGGAAPRPTVLRAASGNGRAVAFNDFQKTPMGVAPWDNSNTQVALLGVWSAAEAGIEVPADYWKAAEQHWRAKQLPDGQWGYSDFTLGGRLSMTCAGVASLAITHDYLHAADFASKFSEAAAPAELAKAVGWLDAADNAVRLNGGSNGSNGYDLYALERVGRATGNKYFGAHDWYRELAERALAAQRPDGSWPAPATADAQANAVTETAFHLLFLARGRQPILMNKLRSGGRWYNRPRDAANAARYVSRATERPVGWQVVTADRPGHELLDAPILYVAAADPPPLTDAQYASIRQYVQAGGMVLLHADGGSKAFADWAPQFVAKVCPPYELRDLPPTHELFNLSFKVGGSAKLKAASNGSRLLVVLAETDLAGAWQARDDKARAPAFQLLANLHLYATGKAAPRVRLRSPPVGPAAGDPVATFGVARLRYAGNWDPEPGAWPRFASAFRRETGAAIDARETLMADLAPATLGGLATPVGPSTTATRPPATRPAAAGPVVAHLTGTAAAAFTPHEVAAVSAYVAAGGVLLVDACGGPVCGGQDAFAESVRAGLFSAAFPGMTLRYAGPADPPLVRGQPAVTDDLARLVLRPYAREHRGAKPDKFLVGRYGGGWVVFSPMDLTTGLVGTSAWGVMGYTPETCKGVVKNILVWAATGRGDPVAGASTDRKSVPTTTGGT